MIQLCTFFVRCFRKSMMTSLVLMSLEWMGRNIQEDEKETREENLLYKVS